MDLWKRRGNNTTVWQQGADARHAGLNAAMAAQGENAQPHGSTAGQAREGGWLQGEPRGSTAPPARRNGKHWGGEPGEAGPVGTTGRSPRPVRPAPARRERACAARMRPGPASAAALTDVVSPPRPCPARPPVPGEWMDGWKTRYVGRWVSFLSEGKCFRSGCWRRGGRVSPLPAGCSFAAFGPPAPGPPRGEVRRPLSPLSAGPRLCHTGGVVPPALTPSCTRCHSPSPLGTQLAWL